MNKYYITIFLMLVWLMPARVAALDPPALAVPAGLSLAEIKMTGSEFVMLYNNSGSAISDLSKYWLYVFNNLNPLAPNVSSSTQQLPAVSLGNNQTVLLSANGGATCGAAVTNKLNLSLNDSGGFLEVVQVNLVGGILVQTAGDAVSWSSGANSAAGMISSVPSNSSAPNNAYYRYHDGASYHWQKADQDVSNPCQLNVVISGVPTPGPVNPGSPLPPGTPPPASFINSPETGYGLGSNLGLAAALINELLPNPAEPQTDSEDEFVEVYNPNDAAFDLSGYKLQTGLTSLRNYTFPNGTILPPKSFTTFYSADTNLTLSNSGSQVRLIDPSGNVISQSDSYGKASEGQSWALADSKWYWTKTVTPNQANVINEATTAGSSSNKQSSTNKTSSVGQVKGASTSTGQSAAGRPAGLHPLVLAAVGSAAVAYAIYEYRHDLANRLYQFRRYRATRRAIGAESQTAHSHRTIIRFGRWQDYLRARFSSWFGK